MKTRSAWLFVALVASSVPARAADLCMTLPQARAAHPGKYLSYRLNGRQQCWNNHGPAHRSVVRHRATTAKAGTGPVPVPRSTVLWPNLASVAIPLDAALYDPTSATGWPKLIDVDEITGPVSDASGNAPQDACCWPKIEPPFAERWQAMPASWFFTALHLELKP
jgi:hypothetical protein